MPKLVPCKRTTDCMYQAGHPGNCDYPRWPTTAELQALNKKVTSNQVGGDHYSKMDIQPWEVIERSGLDFFEGNVIKYVMRYRSKNGLEDLEKARHYLDYLIEREQKNGT